MSDEMVMWDMTDLLPEKVDALMLCGEIQAALGAACEGVQINDFEVDGRRVRRLLIGIGDVSAAEAEYAALQTVIREHQTAPALPTGPVAGESRGTLAELKADIAAARDDAAAVRAMRAYLNALEVG